MSRRECAICEEPLDDQTQTAVVKERGLNSFIEASKKRQDGKVVFFNRNTEVEVHDKCRKQYVNERMIAAYLKKSHESAPEEHGVRSCSPPFSFQTHCFLCGKLVPLDHAQKQVKKAPPKRNPVYTVRTLGVRESVLKLAKNRKDEFGNAIVRRVEQVNDLVAADAQYHLRCMQMLHKSETKQHAAGRPLDDNVDAAMNSIFTFLEKSDEECQFTIEELLEAISGDFRPQPATVRSRLLAKYGDDILITTTKPYIVCFKATGHRAINELWFREVQKLPEREERRRIVQAAATIIVEDIRSQVNDISHYPPSASFLDGHENLIPDTLRLFTDTVVLSKKRGDLDKWQRKSFAIAHAIMLAVRPNSFLSPLLIGLAVFVYKRFGSRKLVDLLSSLGFCVSYTEAVRLEVSSIMNPPLAVKQPALCQIVCDNADYNIHTLDGHQTFHSLGSIQCVTPKSAIIPGQQIARLKEIPKAQTVGNIAAIQLKVFESTDTNGLGAIKIDDLSARFSHDKMIVPSAPNLLWLYSKFKEISGIAGWNAFMGEVTREVPYQTTFIECLPFINSHPNDLNTLYTALLYAVEKTWSLGQETTIVTFDQPLYLKSREIMASRPDDPKLSNVVVRLGGFHMLMSFMGAVGFIMEGSGLRELFNTVYAANSIDKIMNGHAYARAVRAHLLAYTTLAKIILQSLDLSSSVLYEVEQLLFAGDRTEILTAHENDSLKELTTAFTAKLHELENLGPTAKLWVQYFKMTTLIFRFIESERMGNWTLHLQTTYDMLPYFHASGHFSYAKCGHMYLQDMLKLEETMLPNEFLAFTAQGSFTVRRSEKCWCGTWSDMAIEQSLMKQMKVEGGLSRARGFSEGILARWTLGMASLQHITDAMDDFCGTNFSTSEQHVDCRDARVRRDKEDSNKMLYWFNQHPPFPSIQELISISRGIVGNEKVNCHLAWEVGSEGIANIFGGDFKTVKFRRKDRVLPLATMTTAIVVNNKPVMINPDTLFQRMCVAKQSEEELKDFLTYELSPYPLALFDGYGMLRKGTKSTLYKEFQPMADAKLDKNTRYVIDGGFLLHRVVWIKGQSFTDICNAYIRFVQTKYGGGCVVVFDGYPEGPDGTKSMERLRRSKVKHSVEVQFSPTMTPTMSQENFLSNDKNKSRFIELLRSRLSEAGIESRQAIEDADALIIRTAQSMASTHGTVAVVGEDVDLLVIMIGIRTSPNVFFLKPGKGKVPPTLYSPGSSLEEPLSHHILFLHAVSGCDSTSAMFNQGKAKFLKTLKKNPDILNYLEHYMDPTAEVEELVNAGEKFLVALYGGDHHTTRLNELRYKLYLSTAYKVTGNMASIPPTEAAAREHFLRVYHQVQQWLDNQLNPEQWGWKSSRNGLIPTSTAKAPAPDKLLRKVSCKCKGDCRGSCGCRRVGLYCSRLCTICEGNCLNVDNSCEIDNEDDPDDPPHDPDDPPPVKSPPTILETSVQEVSENPDDSIPVESPKTIAETSAEVALPTDSDQPGPSARQPGAAPSRPKRRKLN